MDFEELEEMDASEIHAKRDNAKELILIERVKIANFAVADETLQSYGRHQGLGKSTLIRNQLARGESRPDLLDESKGSPPSTYFQDSYPGAGEARDSFWSISGNFIYRHHDERKVNLCTPREGLFPIPLNIY